MHDQLTSLCRLLFVIAIAAIVSACIPPQSNRDNPNPPAQETSTQQDNTAQPIILNPPADPIPEPTPQTVTVPEPVTPESEPVAEPVPLPEPLAEPVTDPEIIAVPEPASAVAPEVIPETPQIAEAKPTPEAGTIPEVVAQPAPVITIPKPVTKPMTEPVAVPNPAPAAVPTPTPPSAASSTLRGRLTLTADNDRYLQTNVIAGAAIYYMPADGTHTVTPGSFEVGTLNKRFAPDILVLDTPYFAQPDLFGNFQIENVPASAGELRICHWTCRDYYT